MPFFRIPVDKVAAKISDPKGISRIVEFNESQLAMIKGLEENRFWVHLSARRTGKSFAAAIAALAKLLEPNQQVTVVAPNYNLSSIIWDYVTNFIKQLQLEVEKFNTKDRVVKLINGSIFRLLSAENKEGLVGRAANFLIVDEAAVIENDEYYTQALRPTLSTFPDSRVLFITTPRGKKNYIYKYYQRGQKGPNKQENWGSAKFDYTVNKDLQQSDIDEAKATMPKNQFLQEYYCDWMSFEGQIYAIKEDHKKDLSKIIKPKSPRYDFIGGLDVGYRDETVFVVIATDGDTYFIVDEYVAKEQKTSTIAEKIKELQIYWDVSNIYIDAAAAQTRADLAYDYDIYCDNAIKDIKAGIAHLQNLVEKNNLLFDQDKAHYVYEMMSAYRWNNKTEQEKPIHDESSHASDAVRYAVYSHYKTKMSVYVEN
jgi:hypothetical protein